MTKDLKTLIEDLRLNHEYCPKEVILKAADELESMTKRIEELEAMLERQTARIVELQEHIENFDGEDR
jgi:chromosome segregation ATPase